MQKVFCKGFKKKKKKHRAHVYGFLVKNRPIRAAHNPPPPGAQNYLYLDHLKLIRIVPIQVTLNHFGSVDTYALPLDIFQRFSRAGPRGREWATLGVHPLSWLLSNNRLEEVCGTLTTGTFSSRLLLSNQDKGCTPSVAHSLPLGPALLNISSIKMFVCFFNSSFLMLNWLF